MSDVLNFVAAHDVGIGIAGTFIVIVGLMTGYGRRHRRGTDNFGDDDRR